MAGPGPGSAALLVAFARKTESFFITLSLKHEGQATAVDA